MQMADAGKSTLAKGFGWGEGEHKHLRYMHLRHSQSGEEEVRRHSLPL